MHEFKGFEKLLNLHSKRAKTISKNIIKDGRRTRPTPSSIKRDTERVKQLLTNFCRFEMLITQHFDNEVDYAG